tara:strand:- start:83205 stop:84167 length:963 start_codon:yes stop_codon:yes gene_type:complete
MTDLKIILFGTSGAVPTSTRNLISNAIIRDNELFIFDTGEAIQQSMMKNKVGMNRPTHIFISHMHGDHILGLLGLVQTMSLLLRDKPLFIYGPPGISRFLKSNINIFKIKLNFKLIIKEITPGLAVKTKDYKIYAKKANHSILNYSYVFIESNRPGKFYVSKAKKMGIPEGSLWSKLQNGKSIRYKGKLIRPTDVMGKIRPGRKIGISGDTRPSKSLTRFFSSCDVLIHESTFSSEENDLAIERFHSTSEEAATIAKESSSNILILTHFSSRYKDTKPLEKQACKIHRNSIAGYDSMSFKVPYRDEKRLTKSYVLEQTSR